MLSAIGGKMSIWWDSEKVNRAFSWSLERNLLTLCFATNEKVGKIHINQGREGQ